MSSTGTDVLGPLMTEPFVVGVVVFAEYLHISITAGIANVLVKSRMTGFCAVVVGTSNLVDLVRRSVVRVGADWPCVTLALMPTKRKRSVQEFGEGLCV